MENTHGPHTTNPHSDSSCPNILYRIPTLKSETRFIHFKPFPATLGSAGRAPPTLSWARVSTAWGLPLVTKDYLPETVTHLVDTFDTNWYKHELKFKNKQKVLHVSKVLFFTFFTFLGQGHLEVRVVSGSYSSGRWAGYQKCRLCSPWHKNSRRCRQTVQ